MTRRIPRRVLATSAAAAMATLGVAAPAVADPPADGPGCVVTVDHTRPDTCFATFAAALEFASGGRLAPGPKNTPKDLRGPGLDARIDAANAESERQVRAGARAAVVWTVLSIEYAEPSYTGAYVIYSGSNGNCTTRTTDRDYATPSLLAGWVNEISSFRSYANCWVKHWENPNYGGASVGPTGSRASLGLLDDATSSIEWT
ncbi:hypothetical protein [Jidongwangia harbinensis]|uniref:hypothetical protein n=1 Tax=Jidongwangia harbinensis TaxID=2878561 RepID=UPI001CD979B1|nr:hypothetical protein [Jidongwangia harbinensis]MCA2214378.1 hypothetical protein [Jidongwangia harbinensis]